MTYEVDIGFDVKYAGGTSINGLKTQMNPIKIMEKIHQRMIQEYSNEKSDNTKSTIVMEINGKGKEIKAHHGIMKYYSENEGIETKTRVLEIIGEMIDEICIKTQ